MDKNIDLREFPNSVITNAVNEYIHNKRNRDILKRRYIDGLTYEQLAYQFDMSVRQIKNIIYTNKEELVKKIIIRCWNVHLYMIIYI